MNKIDILIISNKFDFTTDYICLELQQRKKNYLRINRDCFNDYEIEFDINNLLFKITMNNNEYILSEDDLKVIYYRAPIYLRDIYQPQLSIEEQIYRTQWTAFIRNLAVFEKALWINNPVSTFKAENKLLQLKYAKKLNFKIPQTIITNSKKIKLHKQDEYVIKSIDTAFLRVEDKEAFIYTNVVLGQEILESELSLSPVVIQEYINPKIDIRVTIIGDKIYAVKIIKNGNGVSGDWRKYKENLSFIPFNLPDEIEIKCVKLLKELGLSYGAIDLAEMNGIFYFIEINPTGEWAWLVDAAGLKIQKGICDYMENNM